MVWFKGFLQSLPVKVEFAIFQALHAVSHSWAFVPGHLIQRPVFSSCSWRAGVMLDPVLLSNPDWRLLPLGPWSRWPFLWSPWVSTVPRLFHSPRRPLTLCYSHCLHGWGRKRELLIALSPFPHHACPVNMEQGRQRSPALERRVASHFRWREGEAERQIIPQGGTGQITLTAFWMAFEYF